MAIHIRKLKAFFNKDWENIAAKIQILVNTILNIQKNQFNKVNLVWS